MIDVGDRVEVAFTVFGSPERYLGRGYVETWIPTPRGVDLYRIEMDEPVPHRADAITDDKRKSVWARPEQLSHLTLLDLLAEAAQ